MGVAPGEQCVKVHGDGLLPGALRLRLCGGRDAPGHALLVAAYGERQRPAAGAEGRADEPLGHAPHGQQRLGRDVLLGRGRELVHGLLRVCEGAGDKEPLPRAGHGNVEEPQLLAQELALEPVRHGAAREGGVLYSPCGVRELRPQAQLRVHQHAAAQVRAVELPRRVADEHHRELKALRAVDAHYAHRAAAVLVGEGGLLAALAHGAQPVEKAAQPAPARGLKAPGELEEAQQPRAAALPVTHRGAERHAAEALVYLPYERCELRIPRKVAQSVERIEEGAGLLAHLRAGAERGVEVALAGHEAYLRQLVVREAEELRAQHGDERHVLARVVDYREQREDDRDLRGLEKAAGLPGLDGDALAREHAPPDGAGDVHGAQQHGDVAVAEGAEHAALAYLCARLDQAAHHARDVGGLDLYLVRALLVLVRAGQRHGHQLRHGHYAGVLQPRAEPRALVVLHLAEAL